jgi:hypothetical protein
VDVLIGLLQIISSLLVAVLGWLAVDTRKDLKKMSVNIQEIQYQMLNEFMKTSVFEQYRSETRERIHGMSDQIQTLQGLVVEIRTRLQIAQEEKP